MGDVAICKAHREKGPFWKLFPFCSNIIPFSPFYLAHTYRAHILRSNYDYELKRVAMKDKHTPKSLFLSDWYHLLAATAAASTGRVSCLALPSALSPKWVSVCMCLPDLRQAKVGTMIALGSRGKSLQSYKSTIFCRYSLPPLRDNLRVNLSLEWKPKIPWQNNGSNNDEQERRQKCSLWCEQHDSAWGAIRMSNNRHFRLLRWTYTWGSCS
jgi:hypothetical protein